jgi:hypothetical protein
MLSEWPDCLRQSGHSNHNNRMEIVMATNTLAQMQRRHFELIAEIIAKELDGEHREKAAYAFAYTLPMTNGRFDSQRFLEACKVKAFTQGGNQ